MRMLVLYGGFLFVVMPLMIFSSHVRNLPENEKKAISETLKDMNGRIYRARISCSRNSDPHVIRVHGRSRDDAEQKLRDRLGKCRVQMLEGESAPIWKEAIKSAY